VPEPTPAHIDEYRMRLADVIAASQAELPHLAFDKSNSQHLVIVCIYATLVQSASEIATVLERPTVTAGGMVRSFMEAWADLDAALKDAAYVERMKATLEEQKLKHFESIVKVPKNPFHQRMSKEINIGEATKKTKEALKQYIDRGHRPLKIRQRFEAADLMEMYHGVYWHLCLQGHNNISALQQRHILKKDGDYFVLPCPENSTIELIYYFDPLTAVLIDSATKVHAFFKSGRARVWSRRFDEFNGFRQKVYEESYQLSPS
jgi:hypothetical protein